jgi:hypothetical protein
MVPVLPSQMASFGHMSSELVRAAPMTPPLIRGKMTGKKYLNACAAPIFPPPTCRVEMWSDRSLRDEQTAT